MISPELINKFNAGARLARAGDPEGAIRVFEEILGPARTRDPGQPQIATGDFIGQTIMRKAWCFMDLGRYQEARQEFDAPIMQACLGQFDLGILYEYFFSHGNVLGELGEIEQMDDRFARAMGIAADEGDANKVQQCWVNLMNYAVRHEAWEYLERESRTCIKFSENSGLESLGLAAGLRRARALARLGSRDKAIAQLERVEQAAAKAQLKEALEAATRLRAELA